jgi:hypothetical protein
MNSSNTIREKKKRDTMHEIQNWGASQAYKQVFEQLYTINISKLTNTRVNPHKETITG